MVGSSSLGLLATTAMFLSTWYRDPTVTFVDHTKGYVLGMCKE